MEHGQLVAARLLLEAGASALVRTAGGKGDSVLEMAVRAHRGGDASLEERAATAAGVRFVHEGDATLRHSTAKHMFTLLCSFVGPLALAEAEETVARRPASS